MPRALFKRINKASTSRIFNTNLNLNLEFVFSLLFLSSCGYSFSYMEITFSCMKMKLSCHDLFMHETFCKSKLVLYNEVNEVPWKTTVQQQSAFYNHPPSLAMFYQYLKGCFIFDITRHTSNISPSFLRYPGRVLNIGSGKRHQAVSGLRPYCIVVFILTIYII